MSETVQENHPQEQKGEITVYESAVSRSIRDQLKGVLTPRMSSAVRLCMSNVAAYGRPHVPKVAFATGLTQGTVRWAWGMYRKKKLKLAPHNASQIRDIQRYGVERDVAMKMFCASLINQLLEKMMPECQGQLRAQNPLAVEMVKQVIYFTEKLASVQKEIASSSQMQTAISGQKVLERTEVRRVNGRTETRVELLDDGRSELAKMLDADTEA